ncbi:ribonucleoside-diphosphate reductase [Rhizobium ruizarguesonis]
MNREYFPGMGTAVADRTINRNGEKWADVAHRVALGNAMLDPRGANAEQTEYASLHHHLAQASTLMSGRHLQHGDENQPQRPQEVFTNCSTALLRFLNKKLLLSGSGVGGDYSDALMVVDWARKMPHVVCVIDSGHDDILSGKIPDNAYMTARAAKHFYANMKIIHHVVEDSREGWAKAVELIEQLAFHGEDHDTIVLIDFSKVRGFGKPIKGMQNRPASGPGPLMAALVKLAFIRGSGMPPWLAAAYADHILAECVLVGGARRAARIAVKYWKDKSTLQFISMKRPEEFLGKSREMVIALRETGGYFESFLWSSNNSVAVDQEFWDAVEHVRSGRPNATPLQLHAYALWILVMDFNYGDGTGEPGFLNVDKLPANDNYIEQYLKEPFAGSNLYQVNEATKPMLLDLAQRVIDHPYHYIVNPCGEITLFLLGGFCVIADVVPFHAANDDDAEDAFRASTRALIRVNTMDSIYRKEVARTNRIGVGMTGLHEYMWSRFKLGFRDAIAHGDIGPMGITAEAAPFWEMIARFADAVQDEAARYSAELGVVVPHTVRTMKPAGTTSKLFGLTEGAHLPSMRKLLRWVQFRNDDPLVAEYQAKGYPVRKLKSYAGTTIVGFPTAPIITTLGLGDKLVTAAEATVEEQFRYLRLLEHFWLGEVGGNQISYTLKYDPEVIGFDEFEQLMFENVKTVRAVSVMPQIKSVSYEYQPEEPITDEEYDRYVANITEAMVEDVDREHVDCSSGACPIDFNKEAA